MIVFGIARSFRGRAAVRWLCHHCGEREQTGMKYFRYLHLCHIPVLPLGTGQSLVCDHCERLEIGGEIHADLRHRLRAQTLSLHRPLWHFAGLVLVVGLLAVS